MLKKLVIYIVFIISCATLFAQQLTAHRNTVDGSYDFWLCTPAGYRTDSTPRPLIVFLHGRSLCGHDLNRVRRYGPLNAVDRGLDLDALILAPQNHGGAWRPERVMRLVDWVVAHHAVDTNRVYVIGMSLGGFGTIDCAATYPDRFAAAMALCGGGTVKDYCGLASMPLWILHGTADRAVGISASQKVVDAVRACGDGSRLLWTRLDGLNHGRLARIFYLPETYSWLLSHSLADTNRPLCRSYDITPQRINSDIYRALPKLGRLSVPTPPPSD